MDEQKEKFKPQQTRYSQRMKFRKWGQEFVKCKPPTELGDNATNPEPFVRIKKKKVALLLGYCGINYFGMQRNKGFKSIESDLFDALLSSKAITTDAYHEPYLIKYQRAARTDKGVSAVRQVVSLKINEETKVSDINEHLPPVIKVYSFKRVTKSFDSKINCCARTYTYTMPTYVLENDETIPEKYRDYRVSADILTRYNDILKLYIGTHNFHNFTSKKLYHDPSSKRYIMNAECSEAFLNEEMEFLTVKIKGQSFMLHQIRKMIGVSLAIIRGLTTPDIISKAKGPEQYDLPMAPGLGLMLDTVHYERYNKRYGNDGIHEPLTWPDVEDEVIAFRDSIILPHILKTEISDKPMAKWLSTLSFHSYDIRRNCNSMPETSEENNDGDNEEDDCDNNRENNDDECTENADVSTCLEQKTIQNM